MKRRGLITGGLSLLGATALVQAQVQRRPAKIGYLRWSNRRSSNCSSTLPAARALGLTIPQSLLLRADEVIQ